MKLILSRKGFDSSSGGVPSPIFPDGTLLSLPIPDENSAVTYGDIRHNGESIGPLVEALTNRRISSASGAHLDPDLVADSLSRDPGWRPIFGQSGQAQGHLRNQYVGPGDLFLFFGLFRSVEQYQGAYRWLPGSTPRHVIWGWMQVAEVVPLNQPSLPDHEWARYHPHYQRTSYPNNVIYLPPSQLQLDSLESPVAGAGVFPRFSLRRQLTAKDASTVSVWDLPGWFYPAGRKPPLSFHVDKKRWRKRGQRTELHAVARGQEFVLDCDDYPQAIQWARDMVQDVEEDSW